MGENSDLGEYVSCLFCYKLLILCAVKALVHSGD